MENRTRKVLSQFSRQEWRNKAAINQAHLKYSREHILKNYKNLKQPSITLTEELSEFILSQPSPPLLTAIFPFSHSLGEEVNSRKHIAREKRVEQMPEWYEEEEPKESIVSLVVQENVEKIVKEEPHSEVKIVFMGKGVKNLEKIEEKDLEEQFSRIDVKVEEKLKKEVVEDDYSMPEWDDPVEEEFEFEPIKPVKPLAPVFDVNLLRYHFAVGNPFIQILLDFGVPAGKGSMTFTPGSKPFEKIWYYKDLEKNIQGPFSTLEMFAWTIRDCFPPDLEISVGVGSYFVPMNIFNELSQLDKSELSTEPPAEIKDSGFSLYESKTEAPATISTPDMMPKVEEKDEKHKGPKTLEEIESLQQTLMGKSSENSSPKLSKSIKPNEAATFELKNFLGLITKK